MLVKIASFVFSTRRLLLVKVATFMCFRGFCLCVFCWIFFIVVVCLFVCLLLFFLFFVVVGFFVCFFLGGCLTTMNE